MQTFGELFFSFGKAIDNKFAENTSQMESFRLRMARWNLHQKTKAEI